MTLLYALSVSIRMLSTTVNSYVSFTKALRFHLLLIIREKGRRRAWQPCCELLPNFAVFRVFYLLFCCFSYWMSTLFIVYDRHTLLEIAPPSHIGNRTLSSLMPALCLQTSKPFVWAAQQRKRRRKRGKRAGFLVRLRRHAFRPPLPTILLANVQSLDNKLCELQARISYQRETRDCCVICLTETWMSAMVPDSTIELMGFSVHRSDRTKELTGKSRGGGVCCYINNLWCDERNLHSIKSFCSPDLEFNMLLCRPFWLPREFTAIIIMAVYIPPSSQHRPGTQGTVWNIIEQETAHPDAAFVVMGDFNKARIEQ